MGAVKKGVIPRNGPLVKKCTRVISGVTLPVGAPPLSDEKCPPPLKFFVSLKKKKKKKKKRSGTFFLAPLQLFAPPEAKKGTPNIFFASTER